MLGHRYRTHPVESAGDPAICDLGLNRATFATGGAIRCGFRQDWSRDLSGPAITSLAIDHIKFYTLAPPVVPPVIRNAAGQSHVCERNGKS